MTATITALSPATAAPVQRAKPNYAYIDCVRGYAVVLVITSHVTQTFAQLPYPVARIFEQGWYGVQLFFIASSLTLLMSWHYEAAETSSVSVPRFFIRRFFRIAPAYYCAAALYFLIDPPTGGLDITQLIASLAFVNAWHPALAPTVAGAWTVVPGGWSIGVEFSFYALFPLAAAWATSMGRSLVLLLFSVGAGWLLNSWAWHGLTESYDATSVDQFIYYWFPNQACVFIMGFVLFYAIRWANGIAYAQWRRRIAVYQHLIFAGIAVAFVVLVRMPLPRWTSLASPDVSILLPLGLLFASFVFVLSQLEFSLWTNPFVAALGRVSFSAYLLHFAVIQLAQTIQPRLFEVTGYSAILTFGMTLPAMIVATFCLSWLSYRAIELPMIDFGKIVARQIVPRKPARGR